jgi:hypothetical protein
VFRIFKTKSLVTAACLLLQPVLWGESAYATFRQSARYFGTLGLGSFDGKYPLDDTDNGLNATDLSRFGMNISVTDDSEWSFFTELVAQPNAVDASWYFVNWRPLDPLIVRVGKTRFVNWLYSETRSIGYTARSPVARCSAST